MSTTDPTERSPEKFRGEIVAAALLIAAFWLQLVMALPQLSATSDELPHLVAGYLYWKTQDFKINKEHPPLVKLIAAAPLLYLRPKFDSNWILLNPGSGVREWDMGFRFLYENNADQLLLWGRLPMTFIAVLGAVVTFLWARDMFGRAAGLFALSLYAFSPNLLAHGMLITTDVPLTSFTILTLYLFWKQKPPPSWGSSVGLGLALGAAMSSKFSGALWPLIISLLAGLRASRGPDRGRRLVAEAKGLLVTGAVAFVFIQATFLFSAAPFAYFEGASWVNMNHSPTALYFLFGQFKPNGWWYYFLLAFLVKATIPTIVPALLALMDLVKRKLECAWNEMVLLAAVLIYMVVVSLWADNLGVRYLLPVFPLLFIWSSRIIPDVWQKTSGKVACVALAGWQAWAALSSFPNYLPYFNEIVGGPARGTLYLTDSNVDWGQAIKQIPQYLRQHSSGRVEVFSFSPFDNPQYYGVQAPYREPKEMMKLLVSGRPQPGMYIISAHWLQWMMFRDPAWRAYSPAGRIGDSLWVYRF